MLSLFRTNQITGVLATLLFAFGIRAAWWLQIWEPLSGMEGFCSDWIAQQYPATPWFQYVASSLLVTFQAVFLNQLLNSFRLNDNPNYFYAALFVWLSSFCPAFLFLSAPLLANTFLIFALSQILLVYQRGTATIPMYNTGFWLGIAALFCWGYVVFLLWAFIAWRILTSYKLREWIVLLLGFATPWLLTGTWLFWNDQLPSLWEKGVMAPTQWLAFDWIPYFYWPTILGLAMYGLLGLIVFFSAGSFYFKQKMQAQKVLSILYWMIPIGGLPILFQKDLSLLQLLVWTVPLSALVAIGFHRLRPSTAESLFWLLIFVLIGLHVLPLIQTG